MFKLKIETCLVLLFASQCVGCVTSDKEAVVVPVRAEALTDGGTLKFEFFTYVNECDGSGTERLEFFLTPVKILGDSDVLEANALYWGNYTGPINTNRYGLVTSAKDKERILNALELYRLQYSYYYRTLDGMLNAYYNSPKQNFSEQIEYYLLTSQTTANRAYDLSGYVIEWINHDSITSP